jgi:hypothetical protein
MLRDSRVQLPAVVAMLLLALFAWFAPDEALAQSFWARKDQASPSNSTVSPGATSRRLSTVVCGVRPGPLG